LIVRSNSSARKPGVSRVSMNSAKVSAFHFDRVDIATPWLSPPAYDEIDDAVSARASAKAILSRAAVPSLMRPMHTEARPSLPTGSRSAPPGKVRSRLTIGRVCCSTR
jgi:hypothetical protein